MGCLCQTIVFLEKELKDLQAAEKHTKLAASSSTYTRRNMRLSGSFFQQGFFLEGHQDELCAVLRASYDASYETIDSANTKVKDEIDLVETDLKNYRLIDEQYHKEQEEKEKNEEKK